MNKKILTSELLNHLSNSFGDAFYLLDSQVFEKNYQDLTTAFKSYYSKFNIAYSYRPITLPNFQNG